ncbi:MAG: hypothetical protein K2Y42_09225 [Hyphomicrobium sp.]|uniref:hypothetical protein n=1 Tax=Hyphomicrobium sp. TaxID=82 RepID=UPI0025C2FE5E|nr:hypothetical protein [Hyphomicrobium sp.]MBX9862919.1 hypothetical protein [Hyphomicrobium sp.]
MPVFELQDPASGKTFEVEAPDVQAAVGAFKQFSGPKQQDPMSWGQAAGTAVSNIPASAQRFGESIWHAVTNPVETVSNIAEVGYGAGSKAVGAAADAVGIDMDQEAKANREAKFNAVKDFFAERYGGEENIKRTLAEDPVGMAADLGTILSGGTAVASRIPGVASAASKAGRIADTAVSATGRLEQPLRAAGSKSAAIARGVLNPVEGAINATKFAGRNVVAPIIGTMTGAGTESVRAAGQAGAQGNRAFLENMRGQAGINDTIDMAQSAMGQIRKERSDAYKAGMETVKASDAPVSYAPIMKSLSEAHKKAYYRDVPIDDVAAKTLDEIQGKINQFREIEKASPADVSYRSAEALDALKQAVGEIRQRTMPNTKARSVADGIYNTIKSEITRQVPEYAKTMKAYSQASDQINDLSKTFSLGERAAPDTTARKLQSVMRNNVNTNYGRRTRLMEELARYEPDLPASLAGQAMSSPTPRGLQSLAAVGTGLTGLGGATGVAAVNPMSLAALPFMSPRLMGEAAYATGTAGRMLESLSRKTGLSKEALAQILLGARGAGELSSASELSGE